MLEKKPTQTEKRQYYRFNESLMISYSIMNSTIKEDDVEQQKTTEFLDVFSSMSGQLKMSLSRLHTHSPEASNCFKILDAKINLLAQTVLYQSNDNNLKERIVNISAGGISFGVNELIMVDTVLAIQLVLPRELNVLNIKATVVKCQKSQETDFPYYISTQFHHSNDLTEDVIVRHIMQGQSDQLRAKKAD